MPVVRVHLARQDAGPGCRTCAAARTEEAPMIWEAGIRCDGCGVSHEMPGARTAKARREMAETCGWTCRLQCVTDPPAAPLYESRDYCARCWQLVERRTTRQLYVSDELFLRTQSAAGGDPDRVQVVFRDALIKALDEAERERPPAKPARQVACRGRIGPCRSPLVWRGVTRCGCSGLTLATSTR